jgi:drug/metabolite transporter (DMT)-like permease
MKFFLIFIVVGITVFTAIIQEKFSSIDLNDYFIFFIFYFLIITLMFLRFLAWFFLHRTYMLSSTYILTSSHFVIIYIISIFYYGEIITTTKVIGCLLIACGIYFIEKNYNLETND